ncbi:MAG: hypothetical protein ACYC55_06855 [Candidatus Geothermincolia bacterium]
MKKRNLMVLAAFTVLVLAFTFPLLLHLNDGVAGGSIDTLLNSWIMSWDTHTLFRAPLQLFDANINYPSASSLAFSEHLLTLAVLSLPLKLVGASPILVHNLLLLLGLVIAGFGAFLLIDYLTRNGYAAFAGGAFFALAPYHLSKMAHLHISFLAFLPLLLWQLFKYLDTGRPRHLALFGVLFLAQALTGWYLMALSLLAVAAVLGARLLTRDILKTLGRRVMPAVGVLALCGLLILPLALPYLRNRTRYPEFERPLEEVSLYSATPADYLGVPPQNLLYGSAGAPFRQRDIGIGYNAERTLFPGFVILLLAAAGLLTLLRRRPRANGGPGARVEKADAEPGARVEEADGEREANVGKTEGKPEARVDKTDGARRESDFLFRVLPFVALAVVAFVLSFGPSIGGRRNLLFLALYHSGFFSFVRMPARYNVLGMLSLSVLGAYGLCRLMAVFRVDRSALVRRLVAGGAIALLLLELATFDLPISPVPSKGEIPESYRVLAGQDAGAAIDAPLGDLSGVAVYEGMIDLVMPNPKDYIEHENLAVYYTAFHWQKLVNGFSGYYPPFYRRLVMEMQAFPSARSLALLEASGVRYLAWHWDWAPGGRAVWEPRLAEWPQLELLEDGAEVSLYRIAAGPGATATGELQPRLALPAAVAAGSEFRMSLVLDNATALPYFNPEERKARARLVWRDAAGAEVLADDADCYLPLLLGAGESDKVVLEASAPAAPGHYRLELTVPAPRGLTGQDDRAAEVILSSGELEVAAALPQAEVPPGVVTMNVLSASVSGSLPVAASGLLSVQVDLRNSRNETLRSSSDTFGHGAVNIAFRWMKDGEQVWEEQRATLPCDLLPGQRESCPALIRAPLEPGDYVLQCALVREGDRWLEGPFSIDVTVTGNSGSRR